ncbi:hypothetical protein BUALT_Bualt07G0057700 [Buddleja alternifolia]|uniref:Uncharacterized protein n=1 Tax=Buddleja alternifolia TaxID=168488 RepID=A0AAV6XCS3_9LAMI|nr:hypothetical protein BUALT_Bualt07G0057700 [Buddleja alternifolia]
MEDCVAKDQSSASGRSTSRLLRYPLRSATKSKEEKPPLVDSTNSASATKRGRPASDVSKSVNVLDLSGKEKSAKPPRRRLSVPSKSNASPAPKSFGNITPISEARAKRSSVNQGKSDTPLSDVSRSSNRKKFSVLSSASYWLSQIKLSESASKHVISLGFFKLALEAGCEPLQRMSDELKSYVRRHDLSEHGESVKELFESYKIPENCEQSQVSENCSQVPTEGNQLSDDDIHSSSSSITDAEKLKPKSLDINADETNQVKKANNETTQKDDANSASVKKTRKSVSKNAANSKSGSEARGRSIQKKPQKPIKQELGQDKEKAKIQGKKSARGEVPLNPTSEEEALQENKENKGAPEMQEISLTEV